MSDSAENRSNSDREMHLFDHLHELRKCLIVSISAILFCAIIAYFFSGSIFGLLAGPYDAAFIGGSLIGTGPTEAFLLKIKIAIFSGIILGSPVIFYQVWRFVAPGLLASERKMALPFVMLSTTLFLGGILFCYFLVLPYAYEFFSDQYRSIGVTPTIKISEHLGFLTRTLLAFGIIFEMPALAYFLGRLGIITAQTLIKGTRLAIVLIFLVAAILTPPDVLTQLLMAGPLMLLYGLSILIVKHTAKPADESENIGR